jgi:hypothetical protein
VRYAALRQFTAAGDRTTELDYYSPAVDLLMHNRLITLAARYRPLPGNSVVPFDIVRGVLDLIRGKVADGTGR